MLTLTRCALVHHRQEFERALKLKPEQLIAELRQLATQARPVSSSSELAGVLELPLDVQARAEMLMTVAQHKLSTYHRADIFPRYDQVCVCCAVLLLSAGSSV
jgi:hypothetical protein